MLLGLLFTNLRLLGIMNALSASSQATHLLDNLTWPSLVPRSADFDTVTPVVNTTEPVMGSARIKQPYTPLAMILTAVPVGIIIFAIVFGNALVIIAVLRDSHLKRQPQNALIVSLAVADLLVGLLIMPLTLTYELVDEWTLGGVLCELWLALDVLFVTASILNLCAISLDRYWSLTIPTSYPQRRTLGRMLFMILIVWLAAFAISFPPLVGWRPEERAADDCVLSDQIGYVMYSAFGSFYIPVAVLLFVYARIYCISRKRKRKTIRSKVTEAKKLSWASGLRRLVTRRHTKLSYMRSSERTIMENGTVSSVIVMVKEDVQNGSLVHKSHSPSTSLAPESPGADYAAVIARVRALATIRQDSIDQSETYSRKTTDASNGTDATVITVPGTGDGLGHVMAIASAAAAHSRQEHRSETLNAKAYELQTQLKQRRKLVRRRERQATVVLGFVLGSFVVSWMPFFCSYLLSAIGCRTPDLIFDIIFWLGYCNSAFNPFIYNFFNRDFRRAFRRILCDPITRKFSVISSSVSTSFQSRDKLRSRMNYSTTPMSEKRKRHNRSTRRRASIGSVTRTEME